MTHAQVEIVITGILSFIFSVLIDPLCFVNSYSWRSNDLGAFQNHNFLGF